LANTFRVNVVCAKSVRSPILHIGHTSYLYTKSEDIYLLITTNHNADAALIFEVLFRVVRQFGELVGKPLSAATLKTHYALVYEMIDELLDHGQPQTLAQDALLVSEAKKKKQSSGLSSFLSSSSSSSSPGLRPNITSEITGATPWRSADIKYKKNEVFIDVIESVNMLVSAKGTLLRADVEGQIKVKAYLTGMPDCKFGMNDKILMEHEVAQGKKHRRTTVGVQMDHCSFHQCVRLGKFGTDRTVSFCPPDGEFELMHYRISENVYLPFKLFPQIDEVSATKIDIRVRIKAEFTSTLMAYDVLVKIPTPLSTCDSVIETTSGKARYRPQFNAFLWKIKKISGTAEAIFTAKVSLSPMVKKEWSRPPIALQFRVPMFTSSGVKVRFLKVVEPHLRYVPIKWVRYVTNASTYQHRI